VPFTKATIVSSIFVSHLPVHDAAPRFSGTIACIESRIVSMSSPVGDEIDWPP